MTDEELDQLIHRLELDGADPALAGLYRVINGHAVSQMAVCEAAAAALRKLRAERDALRGLLREARPFVTGFADDYGDEYRDYERATVQRLRAERDVLRKQLEERRECCTIKGNRTLRLEIERDALRRALAKIRKECRMMASDWDHRSSGPKALRRIQSMCNAALDGREDQP